MGWELIRTVGGTWRIDDMDEDAPLMTFHGHDAEKNARLVMRALQTYGESLSRQ